MTTIHEKSKEQDCYFYYYSTCTKGDACQFRHEPAALRNETICKYWLQGKCNKPNCFFRHMEITLNRSSIPCYHEGQPGGCKKVHCPFKHINVLNHPREEDALKHPDIILPLKDTNKTDEDRANRMKEEITSLKTTNRVVLIAENTRRPSSQCIVSLKDDDSDIEGSPMKRKATFTSHQYDELRKLHEILDAQQMLIGYGPNQNSPLSCASDGSWASIDDENDAIHKRLDLLNRNRQVYIKSSSTAPSFNSGVEVGTETPQSDNIHFESNSQKRSRSSIKSRLGKNSIEESVQLSENVRQRLNNQKPDESVNSRLNSLKRCTLKYSSDVTVGNSNLSNLQIKSLKEIRARKRKLSDVEVIRHIHKRSLTGLSTKRKHKPIVFDLELPVLNTTKVNIPDEENNKISSPVQNTAQVNLPVQNAIKINLPIQNTTKVNLVVQTNTEVNSSTKLKKLSEPASSNNIKSVGLKYDRNVSISDLSEDILLGDVTVDYDEDLDEDLLI